MGNIHQGILEALKNAPGVQAHKGNIRIQFKLPDQSNHVRKSLGLPLSIMNIEAAKVRLSIIKLDISNGLYKNDPQAFWEKNFPTNHNFQSKSISVKNCFSEYIKENSGNLSDSIKDKLKSSLNWLSHYYLADSSIDTITKANLDKIRKMTVLGNKKVNFSGCASSTVKEYTNTFKRVLDHAVEKEYIKLNPVQQLKALPKDDYGLDNQDDDIRPFSQNELNSLIDVVHLPKIKLMVSILAWTGIRHGELKALSWEDVDPNLNFIHIKYNLTRKGNIKLTKTKAGIRKVDLLPAARQVLVQMKILTLNVPPQLDVIHYKNNKTKSLMRRRVFLSRDNQPYKRPELTTVPKQWANWLKEANLTYRPAYQLRHTYASQMLMAGAQPTWLASQMGHSDTSMISKIYGKWIPLQDPDYINNLAVKLGQINKN